MSNSNDDWLTSNITISSPDYDYTSSIDTITLTSSISSPSSSYFYNTAAGMAGSSAGTYTIATGATSTTLGTIDITGSSFNWINPTPFVDGFPEWSDFQDMSKTYPGLEKAYENLKVVYKLCKDDWESRKKGE